MIKKSVALENKQNILFALSNNCALHGACFHKVNICSKLLKNTSEESMSITPIKENHGSVVCFSAYLKKTVTPYYFPLYDLSFVRNQVKLLVKICIFWSGLFNC